MKKSLSLFILAVFISFFLLTCGGGGGPGGADPVAPSGPGPSGQYVLEYEVDYNPQRSSYLCVYGWTTSPLIEFYIVESWGEWRPPGGTSKGTVTINGGTYDIYETTRTNQPSVQGTQTFQQYWSVRTAKKTQGTISISEHFDAWKAKGMNLGKMFEIALCIEGYNASSQSSGTANVTKNILKVNGVEINGGGAGSVSPESHTVNQGGPTQRAGTFDGYDYEAWIDSRGNPGGTGTMTLNGGGRFNCSWSGAENMLFRMGRKF